MSDVRIRRLREQILAHNLDCESLKLRAYPNSMRRPGSLLTRPLPFGCTTNHRYRLQVGIRGISRQTWEHLTLMG